MVAAARRIGAETSATRAQIMAAAAQLIREEGYGAVSTRRVAAAAGLKPSLVHYYFRTTDDLLIAVSRHGADESDRMIAEALEADDPVRALWQFFIDSSRTAMALEFMALANHREGVRAHMAEHSAAMRARQVSILERLLRDRPGGPGAAGLAGCPPAALSVVLAGIGRAIVMEGGLGVTEGHDEAIAFVERWLEQLAPAPGRPRDAAPEAA